MSLPAPLEPSPLGTKEYWDALYTTELSNHAANASDIGTCWFDDSDAQARILRLLRSLTDDPLSDSEDGDEDEHEHEKPEPRLARAHTSFLDLGCGNGALLLALREHGWLGRMLGVDYSPQSIQLATRIAQSSLAESAPPVSFAEWDLLHGPPPPPDSLRAWDVVLDKGTFDAVSLGGGRGRERYRERVVPLVRPGGLFVVTSCNWTEDELRAWFQRDAQDEGGEEFRVVARVEYPTFTFGGAQGQTITTLCFQRGRASSEEVVEAE